MSTTNSKLNTADSEILVYRARWVCPVDLPPIPNAAIAVKDSRIQSVGPVASVLSSVPNANRRVIDLGDAAVVPGLVNAHTHLEFSDLESPLGVHGINFTDWIRQVVAQRRATQTADSGQSANHAKTKSIARGMAESFEFGVWSIGEIATMSFQASDYAHENPIQSTVVFLEQLGRGETTCQQKHQESARFFEDVSISPAFNLKPGLSPHAPYSVGTDLLRQLVEHATRTACPLAMHLAETIEEREFVENLSGDFVSLLKDFGIWDVQNFANRLSILDTLKALSQAPSTLVVHGNYLTDQELDFIATRADRMSIAYCPRTHRYFGHTKYPLSNMLSRNINVCVGTDSRASNPDLSLFRELQHVAAQFPELDANLILAMGTRNGAKAIGLSEHYGSFEIGQPAALSLVTPEEAVSDGEPMNWMFKAGSVCKPMVPGFGSSN